MKAIDIIIEKHDKQTDSRTKRQFVSIIKWLKAKANGTVQASTGFGKSRVALEIISLFRRGDSSRKVVIAVPTIALKNQWNAQLVEWKLNENSTVYVINSLIKEPFIKCDLLIIDEIQREGAETFSRIFDIVEYKFILGLTATFERADGKHEVMRKYAPVIDDVPLKEARAKGWVANYRHYNLGITLPDENQAEYDKLSEIFGRAMDRFGRDFELMRKCSYSEEPKFGTPYVVHMAIELGWRGNNLTQAKANVNFNRDKPVKDRISIWGDEQHKFSPRSLYIWAVIGMKANRSIMNFIYDNEIKNNITIELIEKLNRRAITFTQYTKTIDAIKESFGNKCVMYHSNMKSIMRNKLFEREYKNMKAAKRYVEKHPEWTIKEKHNKIYIQTHKEVKISAKTLKKEALHKINDYKSIKVIASGKALEEGIDVPGLELGISMSRNSSKIAAIQKCGRVLRKHTLADGEEKIAIFIDVFLKNTKDEQWLKNSQYGMIGMIPVDNVEELLEREAKYNDK